MKKFVYLLFSLLATTMVLSSCSQEENPEIIPDPIPGYAEVFGNISKDGETFYFTIEKCTRTYNAVSDRWSSTGPELDFVHGLKLKVDQRSETDSIVLRKLTECIGHSVKATVEVRSFMSAISSPEQDISIIVESISETDADVKSLATKDGEYDYFNPEPPAWFFEPMSRSSLMLEGHYEVINVFVHILQTTDGKKPRIPRSKEEVRDAVVERLNEDFQNNNAHIVFRAAGVDEINCINSTFDIDDDDLVINTLKKNNLASALNVYVIGAIKEPNHALGKAPVIANACIIHPNYYDRPDITHEVGHCLGLYHTHRGTAIKWKQYNHLDGKQDYGDAEYVDGSNSSTAGDFITDTPADPGLWPWSDYSWDSTITDDHGDRYNP
ncbi:MAG: hypothetical protein J6C91_09300, partial [Muribaculaceae bacterium]|nr:hypothetical protein [Muribaculaceae bacterium]